MLKFELDACFFGFSAFIFFKGFVNCANATYMYMEMDGWMDGWIDRYIWSACVTFYLMFRSKL